MARIRLGELLVRARVIQPSLLEAALNEQRRWGGRLGDILVRMNSGLEELIVRALSKQLGVPAADLSTFRALPLQVLAKIPADKAEQLMCVPLKLKDDEKTLVVAMAEPENLATVDTLHALSGCRISPAIASRTAIARAIQRFYRGIHVEDEVESSFHLTDSAGNTVARKPEARPAPELPAEDEPLAGPLAPKPRAAESLAGTADLVQKLESVQRSEVGALKALVELMIEKGVFTREEYLAKVRRSS